MKTYCGQYERTICCRNPVQNSDSTQTTLDGTGYFPDTATAEISYLDKVVGFTMSDFARTLNSNGNGTDHAWGGHHLVFSSAGAFNGGEIIGTYPDLLSNNLDIGNGRFIPTGSYDEHFGDLTLWFAADGSSPNG